MCQSTIHNKSIYSQHYRNDNIADISLSGLILEFYFVLSMVMAKQQFDKNLVW